MAFAALMVSSPSRRWGGRSRDGPKRRSTPEERARRAEERRLANERYEQSVREYQAKLARRKRIIRILTFGIGGR